MRQLFNRIQQYLPVEIRQLGEKIYGHLPQSLRYGKIYRETLKFLQYSEHWNQEELENFQLETLRDLVYHAITHVPFYRELYGKTGIASEDIRSLNDIRHLPIVSKDDLRHHRESIKAENYPSSAFQYHTTGGSTAKPVGLYWQANRTVPMEKAFMKRQFDWIGCDLERDAVVNIRGIPPTKGRKFEIIAGNQLRLSSYLMTPETLEEYVQIIREFHPKVLHAYPSSALILAKHLIDRQTTLPSLQVVLCGSEQLFAWQREILQQAFKCRIYSWYGQSEYVSLAGECEYSTEYHFYSEYGITEILKADGTPARPGQTGEIVATGFLNYAFPLIRYRMEDMATLSIHADCRCGRSYKRATRIEGRIQEMIVSKNGNLISMTSINMHDETFDDVYQFQFYQDSPGNITINIVPKHKSPDHKKIRAALQQKLGDQFNITINEVGQIEKTVRGKTRFLIQRIPLGNDWIFQQE